jgi:hypothetical protein
MLIFQEYIESIEKQGVALVSQMIVLSTTSAVDVVEMISRQRG